MSRDTSAPAGSCGQQLGPRSPTREEEGCRELEHGRDRWNQNSQEQRTARTLPPGRLHPRFCISVSPGDRGQLHNQVAREARVKGETGQPEGRRGTIRPFPDLRLPAPWSLWGLLLTDGWNSWFRFLLSPLVSAPFSLFLPLITCLDYMQAQKEELLRAN